MNEWNICKYNEGMKGLMLNNEWRNGIEMNNEWKDEWMKCKWLINEWMG